MNQLELVRKIEHAARTTSLLPNVNANINKIISDRIIRDIEREDRDFLKHLEQNR